MNKSRKIIISLIIILLTIASIALLNNLKGTSLFAKIKEAKKETLAYETLPHDGDRTGFTIGKDGYAKPQARPVDNIYCIEEGTPLHAGNYTYSHDELIDSNRKGLMLYYALTQGTRYRWWRRWLF